MSLFYKESSIGVSKRTCNVVLERAEARVAFMLLVASGATALPNAKGKLSEWSKEPHSKCGVRITSYRGFESLTFRKLKGRFVCLSLLKQANRPFNLNKVPAAACWDYAEIPHFPLLSSFYFLAPVRSNSPCSVRTMICPSRMITRGRGVSCGVSSAVSG